MTPMTRRQFIAASASSLVAASVVPRALGQTANHPKPWYATIRRCGQINYNEIDPLTIDANSWMDYWASLKIEAVLLNGGGIEAMYPTEIPYHHRSPFLGSRDLLGEMIAAARKRNIRAMARMDPTYVFEEALNAHPEWIQRDPDGSPRVRTECPWLIKTCMFTTYFTEQMPAIYREINERYKPDGFFTNAWPSTGALDVCFCPACQKIYREQTGGAPPAVADARSSAYRKYYDVYMDRLAEIWKLWDSVAKENNPDSVYVGNLGGGIRTVKDLKKIAGVAAWFNADTQGRAGDRPIWMSAQQGRVAKSVMGDRITTCVIGAYSNSSTLWRHSSKPDAETTLWTAQSAASGMVPWYHWLGGSPLDNRWRKPGRDFFGWLAANEPHFRNRRSLADVAVLYPQSTISFYRCEGKEERQLNGAPIDSADYLEGLYYALLEGRFLFDLVHQANLSAEALAPYRALLIPNAACLRDAECETIRRYVNSSGSLLATFETSRYNEWGEPRGDFALADLFGVHVAGDVSGPAVNSYMGMDRAHPILESFQDTQILPAPEFHVPVSYLGTESTHLSFVPPYPTFPPEMVYPRIPNTGEPAAIFRELPSSRVVFFPGDVDRTAWRSGNPDLSQLISNSVRWLLGDRPPVATVEGDGMVELFAWETEPGLALHILDYTNPNATRPFIRKFYPIGPLRVNFQVPAGKTVTSARALRSGSNLPLQHSAGAVQFDVPSVRDYEVIALT
ncbi:MAG: alpha-amylase family protein [Candidatus Acidiferrales bacterium]